jgi:hypothetical protein
MTEPIIAIGAGHGGALWVESLRACGYEPHIGHLDLEVEAVAGYRARLQDYVNLDAGASARPCGRGRGRLFLRRRVSSREEDAASNSWDSAITGLAFGSVTCLKPDFAHLGMKRPCRACFQMQSKGSYK